MPSSKNAPCPCCQRQLTLTFHHLIPKSLHRKRYIQKRYSKKERAKGILICRPCHNAIHSFLTLRELSDSYNTMEKIMEHCELKKHFEWAQKQTKNHIRVASKRSQKRLPKIIEACSCEKEETVVNIYEQATSTPVIKSGPGI